MKYWNLLISILLSTNILAQEPKYTPKHLVSSYDTAEFQRIPLQTDGPFRTFLLSPMFIWDVDDNNSTHIKLSRTVLLVLEGHTKKGMREGIVSAFALDSADHRKRYKIYEQTYKNDKLNGEWRTYALNGSLVDFQTYRNDTISGVTKMFWIDGKTIMEERIFVSGPDQYLLKEFNPPGTITRETNFVNGVANGQTRQFYPDGKVKAEAFLINGIPNGLSKYYYPSGQVWIEQEAKDGKPWTVIANYTQDGKKRDAGTLKNGNGTVVYYNEDGTVRETIIYKDGKVVR